MPDGGVRTPDSFRVGRGDPLMLLHGVGGSWHMWRPVLAELAAVADVFVPTLAGHRKAPVAVRPASPASLADDLERRLDQVGIDKCHVVGNSLGGLLALELARRGRTLSALAISPAGAWTDEADRRRLMFMLRTMMLSTRGLGARVALARPATRKRALRLVCEHGDRIPGHAVPGMLADLRACSILTDLARDARHLGPVTRHHVVTACPVGILWSEHDRLIPFERYGRPFTEAFSGAQFGVLDGVGHMPMYDDPAEVARTIRQFVTTGSLGAVTRLGA